VQALHPSCFDEFRLRSGCEEFGGKPQETKSLNDFQRVGAKFKG
jgi:hypothetical protein